jgi:hypothetical protein
MSMMFAAGLPLLEGANQLARSALPDAPVVPHRPRNARKDRIGALLRAAARYELRLAERIAPTG